LMEYPRDSKNARDRARSLTARLTKIVVGIGAPFLSGAGGPPPPVVPE
jgi:hypothetical protein